MKKEINKNSQKVGRRQFIAQASGAVCGGGAALGTFCNVQMMGQLAAAEIPQGNDYRALVCVFLQGGNDSYNMLTPQGASEYDEYALVRGNLSLEHEELLTIPTPGIVGKELGLHPSLPRLKELYSGGQLAFLANVGSLQEKVTASDLESSPGLYPEGLFSHSDQQRQWHTSLPNRSAKSGWLGRMTDLVEELNGPENFATSISVRGVNLGQTGSQSGPYVIGSSGSSGLSGWNDPNRLPLREAVASQLELDYANLLQRAYLSRKKKAIELNGVFSEALENVTSYEGESSATKLGKQLQMVHRIIQAREDFGVRRQTFFVMLDGWDTHSSLLGPHQALLNELDGALSDFQNGLDQSGMGEQVTTFTVSDFGRSLTSNGQGSDHGWGGHQIVMGGAVNGGDVYGQYPDLYEGNPLDVGRGRIIPTTSVDEYFAELACWFGIPISRLAEVLPNLGTFHNLSGSAPPLGFMKQAV